MHGDLEFPVVMMHRRPLKGEPGTMSVGHDRLTLVDKDGAVVLSEPWNRLHSFRRAGGLLHWWAGEERYTIGFNVEGVRHPVLAYEREASARPELERRIVGTAPIGFVPETPKYLRQVVIALGCLFVGVAVLVLVAAVINGDLG